jgi:hypothetical protein
MKLSTLLLSSMLATSVVACKQKITNKQSSTDKKSAAEFIKKNLKPSNNKPPADNCPGCGMG